MKTKHSIILVALALLCMSAYSLADSIIERLGMDHKSAQWSILSNIVRRFDSGPMDNFDDEPFKVPYAKLLSSVVSGDQTAAARELCDYVKNYVNSEKFLNDYNSIREDAIPLQLESSGAGISSLRRNIAVYELNIKNYPNDQSYIAEQKKRKEGDQRSLDSLLEASKKPYPGKEQWEKTYPLHPEVAVKHRLEDYLALVEKVDFNATLTEPDAYKIRKFTNPAYEKKSPEWKAIYRAGKDVNQVVTAFVKEWLKGEIISSTKTTIPTDEDGKKQAVTASPTVASNSGEQITEQPEATAQPVDENGAVQPEKTKKSLLGKLKDKAKAIIKD